MEEPIYIKQCNKPKTYDQRDEWFKEQVAKARSFGTQWCRFSYHPNDDNRVIIEGWERRPRREGEIRWQVTDREPAKKPNQQAAE